MRCSAAGSLAASSRRAPASRSPSSTAARARCRASAAPSGPTASATGSRAIRSIDQLARHQRLRRGAARHLRQLPGRRGARAGLHEPRPGRVEAVRLRRRRVALRRVPRRGVQRLQHPELRPAGARHLGAEHVRRRSRARSARRAWSSWCSSSTSELAGALSPIAGAYFVRSACAGSILAARQAGPAIESAAVSPSTSTTSANVVRSSGCTPNNIETIMRPKHGREDQADDRADRDDLHGVADDQPHHVVRWSRRARGARRSRASAAAPNRRGCRTRRPSPGSPRARRTRVTITARKRCRPVASHSTSSSVVIDETLTS